MQKKLHVLIVVVQSLIHVWLFVTPWTVYPPGSCIHGISQARIMEWVAISFCRGSSPFRGRIYISCISRWNFYCWATRKPSRIFIYTFNILLFHITEFRKLNEINLLRQILLQLVTNLLFSITIFTLANLKMNQGISFLVDLLSALG